jgi:hypothetical protein
MQPVETGATRPALRGTPMQRVPWITASARRIVVEAAHAMLHGIHVARATWSQSRQALTTSTTRRHAGRARPESNRSLGQHAA